MRGSQRIYIAGRMSQREELHLVRKRIWGLGHEVVSTWIDEASDGATNGTARRVAIRDLCQISSADILIIDTLSRLAENAGGGREFELGFAVGQFQHKETWRVGPVNSAFHALVDREFEDWEGALEWLKKKVS